MAGRKPSHSTRSRGLDLNLCRLEAGASGFLYLAQSSTLTLPGVDDGEALRSTLDAMAIVGMSVAERQAVLRTVAAVLHLGNITFTTSDADMSVPADAVAKEALRTVADLIMVSRLLILFLSSRSVSA